MDQFDYIIVGAGSAGCVLAARLSENPAVRVLVIEAGRKDHDPWIHIPATFFKVIEKGRDIKVYEGEAEPALGGRKFLVPQGHVVGGGSSVNAMIYIRGQAADYDEWAALGNPQWSYAQVLPVFKDLENNTRLHNSYHGNQGPLHVSDPVFRHPLNQAFVDAAQEAGLPLNDDFNGAEQAGVGFYQSTTWQAKRWSSATAFLKPALQRPNLKILTETSVDKILFQDKQATGVLVRGGQTYHAQREVILCAGALETPRLLQISGLGPAAHLQAIGISPQHHLPGVGENFQDHVETPIQAEVHGVHSLLGQDRGLRGIGHMLRYALFRRGLLTSNVVASGGFASVTGPDDTGAPRPDIQFHVLPLIVGFIDRVPETVHGITLNPCWLRPKSRGRVQLRSANPQDKVQLFANMMSAPEDIAGQLAGVKLALRILESPALQRIVKRRILPQPATEIRDADLVEHIRATSKTVFHPAGTAKMGPVTDPMAVVGQDLKVHGVRGLRLADCSIMPTLVSGNTNAAAMMIGERCARFISDQINNRA